MTVAENLGDVKENLASDLQQNLFDKRDKKTKELIHRHTLHALNVLKTAHEEFISYLSWDKSLYEKYRRTFKAHEDSVRDLRSQGDSLIDLIGSNEKIPIPDSLKAWFKIVLSKSTEFQSFLNRMREIMDQKEQEAPV